jgi:hypothetical protein
MQRNAMRPILYFFSFVFGRRVSLVNRKADALENPFLALTRILPRSVLRDPYYCYHYHYNGIYT